jgi:hypothetical protein
MRIIDDGDELREFNLSDLVQEFDYNISNLHHNNLDTAEYQLITAQYSYVKFGLILEKFRNECFWKYFREKFLSFREFCQKRIGMNVWQVNSQIKAAHIATRLVYAGFVELPRNISQALALCDLPVERLCEVWGNITRNLASHKITADAIKREIDPDFEPKNSNIRIPRKLNERIIREALEHDLSVPEYLERLVNSRSLSDEPDESVIVENLVEYPEGGSEILDALDRKFKSLQTQKIVTTHIARFDNLMNDLIGQFLPKKQSEVSKT